MNDNTNLTHCLLCENLKEENKKLKAALRLCVDSYVYEEDIKLVSRCEELLK